MRPHHVLVLCTGNSARSILAEALINRLGEGRFVAYSAGSRPKGVPNPVGLQLLADKGFGVADFRSKSWDVFAGLNSPAMDLVITVCDSAAGESCPHWPGAPLSVHWGIADPADVGATPAAQRAAFEEAYRLLAMRVDAMLALPFETMDKVALRRALAQIGRMEGATDLAVTPEGNAS